MVAKDYPLNLNACLEHPHGTHGLWANRFEKTGLHGWLRLVGRGLPVDQLDSWSNGKGRISTRFFFWDLDIPLGLFFKGKFSLGRSFNCRISHISLNWTKKKQSGWWFQCFLFETVLLFHWFAASRTRRNLKSQRLQRGSDMLSPRIYMGDLLAEDVSHLAVAQKNWSRGDERWNDVFMGIWIVQIDILYIIYWYILYFDVFSHDLIV